MPDSQSKLQINGLFLLSQREEVKYFRIVSPSRLLAQVMSVLSFLY